MNLGVRQFVRPNSPRLLLLVTLLAIAGWPGASHAAKPRYVVYYNSDASPVHDLIGLPYTHVIFSFVTLDSKSDNRIALVVEPKLSAALQEVDRLKADGKKVLISFGGGDMTLEAYQTAVGKETELALKMAELIERHDLDGVDLDYELTETLMSPPHSGTFDGRAFLINLTHALNERLPESAAITHAPQAPYLDPDWHQGPYLEILQQAGN
ncbi:MAG: glycoside hydrolase family 18 protein, partial [Pseudomonadota bacterium]